MNNEMDVMILAAGLGKRMRPLTLNTPKPLLKVGDKSLIEHHIQNLSDSGVKRIIINISYLSDLIIEFLKKGEKYGVHIEYSIEPEHPLGTAGGIRQASALFHHDKVLVINGDIYTSYPFCDAKLPEQSNAHLILVDNPSHHPDGDFVLSDNSHLKHKNSHQKNLTFSGIGVYRRSVFESIPQNQVYELAQVFQRLIDENTISGEHSNCDWIDVGTVERLADANKIVEKRNLKQ